VLESFETVNQGETYFHRRLVELPGCFGRRFGQRVRVQTSVDGKWFVMERLALLSPQEGRLEEVAPGMHPLERSLGSERIRYRKIDRK